MGNIRMRETCLDCVRKHLAQALVLVEESLMGYPSHKYLAIGHMAEASSECLQKYPAYANKIRDARVLYAMSDEPPEIMSLIEESLVLDE